MECFRIVNGADIVARMPRHTNSAGAVLDYEHVGRTVLIDEAGEAADGDWAGDISATSRPHLGCTSALGGGRLLGRGRVRRRRLPSA